MISKKNILIKQLAKQIVTKKIRIKFDRKKPNEDEN
jgi:hypothetical protein